jgi:hypothetical protein
MDMSELLVGNTRIDHGGVGETQSGCSRKGSRQPNADLAWRTMAVTGSSPGTVQG